MFETIQKLLATYQDHAPWIVFFSILLAGLNVPISIDLLLILVALLSATHLAAIKVWLFIAFFTGCCLSAWIAYGLGRTIGRKLLDRIFSQEKLMKIESFLSKYGVIALFIGRFIPFGFRNCLFMTTGVSRYNFWKFALIDTLACLVWSTLFFSLFYHLGQNFEGLKAHLKWINIGIFSAFSVAVITFLCYKYKDRLFNKKAS